MATRIHPLPHCDSAAVVRKDFHNNHQAPSETTPLLTKETAVLNSIDPTGLIFKGHHQPLDIWIPYLCFMGLNLSNRRTAAGLGLNKDDVQRMT